MAQAAQPIPAPVALPRVRRRRRESYTDLVWRKFRKSKIAIAGGLIIMALVALAVCSDFFAPTDPVAITMQQAYLPPQPVYFVDPWGRFSLQPFTYQQKSELDPATFLPRWVTDTSRPCKISFFVQGWEYKFLGLFPSRLHLYGTEEGCTFYVLGTDKFGRDLFGRIALAGRISLMLATAATLIIVSIGSTVGIVSGYYGGWMDNLIQRFIEFVQAFPTLPLWMALAAVIPITWNQTLIFITMSCIFALLGWTLLARELRGKVLALRETDFVMAAREMGASDRRIIFRHLFPNCLSHVIVVLTLTIPSIILAESFLSFLGIGIQEPLVSWGTLMREAQSLQTLGSNPWLMWPVAFILLAVIGFNFLGDGLRDAVDPYSIV
ncbi:MAG TPA: ABC transporter permease [Roseiflexaceae bacterium]|nr:ABC transporter permease [Roseiflexaceae bacterium]